MNARLLVAPARLNPSPISKRKAYCSRIWAVDVFSFGGFDLARSISSLFWEMGFCFKTFVLVWGLGLCPGSLLMGVFSKNRLGAVRFTGFWFWLLLFWDDPHGFLPTIFWRWRQRGEGGVTLALFLVLFLRLPLERWEPMCFWWRLFDWALLTLQISLVLLFAFLFLLLRR